MRGDFAGMRQPVLVGMPGDVLERPPQVTQAERLADDGGVQRNSADERLMLRLFGHFVESCR